MTTKQTETRIQRQARRTQEARTAKYAQPLGSLRRRLAEEVLSMRERELIYLASSPAKARAAEVAYIASLHDTDKGL